jgi:hypothetical protein
MTPCVLADLDASYNPEVKKGLCISIPFTYWAEIGTSKSTQDAMQYFCRPETESLYTQLTTGNTMIDEKEQQANFYVTGFPGSGKSSIVLCACLKIASDEKKHVRWISLGTRGVTMVDLVGSTHKLTQIKLDDPEILPAISDFKGDVLVVDGLTKDLFQTIKTSVFFWHANRGGSRLIFVTSKG